MRGNQEHIYAAQIIQQAATVNILTLAQRKDYSELFSKDHLVAEHSLVENNCTKEDAQKSKQLHYLLPTTCIYTTPLMQHIYPGSPKQNLTSYFKGYGNDSRV